MGRLKLFDEEENVDVSKIEIDEEYVKTLEYNKKREDLQRYEELRKRGSAKGDLKFINALLLVKKHDPSLKEKDVKLLSLNLMGVKTNKKKVGI
ncbi:hypothetical protein EZV62_000261 [Acer yangbiense]|uniref:Uncharacterized protein n=1 Tax=Acer yangbiense TaxID=1000413 RepID=A0A5C7ITE4_9ROSI|nr:hypothetical protein EZV62_000261 [Acer yangbiense]